MDEETRTLFDLIGSAEFVQRLKYQLSILPIGQFNLQQALQRGSVALPETLKISVLSVDHQGTMARVRINLFFQSIIAGCNCADDPTPADTLDEYGSATVVLDKNRGLVEIHLD